MSSHTPSKVRSLYKMLLRESTKFHNYNFKEYSLRKVRHDFRKNINCNDPSRVSQLIGEAESNLQMLRRQAVIQNFYKAEPLVIDTRKTNKDNGLESTFSSS
ncbi:LYR motif-containing protein 4 [Tetranychus urticae]|uniref:Complex 1 LYR protein domain-containing protein n=1 Tax=Tetranychus urticae TaxID=32264 RepID=T1KU21_TETUR|nr:LYR motif-containing protein 4 [Tetranychus urticae]